MTIPPAAKLALATVVVAAAAVGAARYARPPKAPIVRKPAVAANVAAPVRDVTLVTTRTAGWRPPRSATPDDAAAAAETEAKGATVAGDRPEPSAAPLEDVIAHSMPGVVLITTPKTRGSGFFVRPDLVVTNAHVVAGFMTVNVTTQNGSHIVSRVAEFSRRIRSHVNPRRANRSARRAPAARIVQRPAARRRRRRARLGANPHAEHRHARHRHRSSS